MRSWIFLGSSSSLGELHHTPPSVAVVAIPSGTVSVEVSPESSKTTIRSKSGGNLNVLKIPSSEKKKVSWQKVPRTHSSSSSIHSHREDLFRITAVTE